MEPLGKKLNSIDGIIKYFAILLASLLFFGFPIALFVPVGHGFNIFNFFIPAFLLATGFSASLLVMLRKGKGRFSFIEISTVVLFLSLLVSSLLNGAPGAEFLKYAGLALIPFTVALTVRVNAAVFIKTLKWSGALLWLVNIIHCYHRLPHINNVGICGNRNWLSALIIASSPLAVWVLKTLLSRFIKDERISFSAALTVILGISAPIISAADSRASIAALILLPVYLLFICMGKKAKVGIAVFMFLLAVLCSFVFIDQISRENKRNVRVPMWTATVSMIGDNPLGIGPGNFESQFPSYVTKDQKVMLNAAETTAHPHNELLHVMAMGGVAAGVCWMLLTGFALFSSFKSREEIYFKVPLFILFIQGMMDKPLDQMPTMLLFYLLAGVVLGQKDFFSLQLKKPEREKLGLYTGVALAMSAAFAFFAFKVIASSWYERKAVIAEHKKETDNALVLYEKSFYYASWRLLPAYKAFIIATIDKSDPAKAIEFFDALESRAPDYRQFNLVKGSFFSQLSISDKEQAKDHLEKAWKSYNRACELNASNVLSFIDRMKFASRFLPPDELEGSYSALISVYKLKSNYGAIELKGSLKEWGTEWRQSKKYSEFLKRSADFMSMMKPVYFHSVYFPQEVQRLLPSFGGPLNIGDMVYATDSYLLMESLPKGDFAFKSAFIFAEVKENGKADFSWPKETLKNKSGSTFSKLCLISMAARNYGYDPFIIRSKKSVVLLKSGKFFRIDQAGLKELSNEEVRQVTKGQVLEYFDYPQGFFYKNEFLAYVLAEAEAAPQYCRNPDYVISNLVKRLAGNSSRIVVAKEPFIDILRRMQGPRQ